MEYQPSIANNNASFSPELPSFATNQGSPKKKSTFKTVLKVIGIIILIVVIGPPLLFALWCLLLIVSSALYILPVIGTVGFGIALTKISKKKENKSNEIFYYGIFFASMAILFIAGYLHTTLGLTCGLQETNLALSLFQIISSIF